MVCQKSEYSMEALFATAAQDSNIRKHADNILFYIAWVFNKRVVWTNCRRTAKLFFDNVFNVFILSKWSKMSEHTYLHGFRIFTKD